MEEPAGNTRGGTRTISDRIAALHREHHGRGADRVTTTVNNGAVVTMLEGCFASVERRLIEQASSSRYGRRGRCSQDWMKPEFVAIVEDALGRRVTQFL